MAPHSESDDLPDLQYPYAPAALPKKLADTGNDVPIDEAAAVLVVGGGPVGMLQALMLAILHKQKCVLIEREPDTTVFPKMEFSNGRSMEIYRAMGLADELRSLSVAAGIGEDHSMDEVIATSLLPGGKLVHVWERPGYGQMREMSRTKNDGSQYLEPHLRLHQIPVERWLREKVEAEELISSHWGTAFVGLEEHNDHVLTEARTSDGQLRRFKSQFVIGCDGGGSSVRKCVGLESKRSYLNLTMAFAHLRSTSLRGQLPFPNFWHGMTTSGGVVVSQNDNDLYTCHYMAPPGVDVTALLADQIVSLTLNGGTEPLPIHVDDWYCKGAWRTDVAVADRFRSERGRVFLAGDAAHQLSPIGGHGLNSGLSDAFDLAWKLSARLDGWAGETLLASYDAERRPVAFENLQHVQDGIAAVQDIFSAPLVHGMGLLNGDGPESIKIRDHLGTVVARGHWLHNQNGNILGVSYRASPVVLDAGEPEERPRGTDSLYVPTTFPGSRAPHVWLADGRSTLDHLSSRAFSIVDFTPARAVSAAFRDAAAELGVPLKLVSWDRSDNGVAAVYEREAVLVRPDMYVAWRSGVGAAESFTLNDALAVLRVATGRASAAGAQ